MALESLLSNPDYVNANPATKEAIFNKFASEDPNYVNANEATKLAIQDKFGIGEAAINRSFENARTENVLAPEFKNPLKVAGQSIIKGVANLGDLAIGAPANYSNLKDYIVGNKEEAPRLAQPVTNFLVRHGVITPENEPNTAVGKVADFALQTVAGGALNPFNIATQTGKGLVQGGKILAKQTALGGAQGIVGGSVAEGLKGSGWENPLALALTTGGAMAVPGALVATRNAPARIINQSMRNVTPEQINAAHNLVKESYRLGDPITGAEAIAKVTGSSPLTGIQRIVENSPNSGETMATFMAERPKANQQAIAAALREISPNEPTSATTKNLEKTGAKLIKEAESSLTKNLAPLYKEAEKQAVPKNDIAGMMTNPKIADAVEYVRSTSKYGVKGEPSNSVKTLMAAKEYLDDQFVKEMNAVTGAEKNASRVTWAANRQLDEFLNTVSPEYAQASKKYEIAQKTQFEPLKEGVVGAIAQGEKPANVLMPQKPETLYPADIKRAVDLLRRKDPNAVRDWTRQNLENVFNETSQNLQSGPNQAGGAKFAATIQGNKQQKENLKTLIEESAGKDAYKGFQSVLNNFEAQGTRQGAGSQTSYNQQFAREMGEGGKLAVAKLAFKPSEVATKYEEWQLNRNSEKLAKMLTDPNSVMLLEELGRTAPKSAKYQAIINSILGGSIAQKDIQENK